MQSAITSVIFTLHGLL